MVTVLFSSITDPSHSGDAIWNGGYKSHELWVKTLRQHGVDAYRVTQDGTIKRWMCEHGPVISLATAKSWVAVGRDIRAVTTWMAACEFMDAMPRVYFYDQELAFTSREHFDELRRRLPTLAKVGTHSRTIQAWYMTMFGITPDYIPEWSDPDYWHPDSDKRQPGVIGYMNEGPQTAQQIEQIKQAVQAAGLAAEFVQVMGDEAAVITQMQRCDLFLGMNPGKHPLWGEGCPRSPQEAMHAGCVVIALDVVGNGEYLKDGYNGWLVRNVSDMAERVIYALQNRIKTEWVRINSVGYSLNYFNPDWRWPAVRWFLNL